jgi:ABC-2 type transport system ATP-binding protein
MVSIQNITKKYGDVVALDQVSLEVGRGELFGLIGPDGAGKTSLFRILATLLLPDQGIATIDGADVVHDYARLRRILGYMPGRFSLYPDLTILENVAFYAAVFDTTLAENYERIKPIYSQIEPFKHRRAGQLSGGMKQKLALSCALVHEPELLLLDEPTTGVDPVSRTEFWDMLQILKQSGLTIIVSTPYMDEADRCDRIALIQKGQIMSVDTPTGITGQYQPDLFAVRGRNTSALLRDLRRFDGVHTCYAFGEDLHVSVARKGALDEKKIHQYLIQQQHPDVVVSRIPPTVEDCFIQLMSQ